jgi:hypothetical protein
MGVWVILLTWVVTLYHWIWALLFALTCRRRTNKVCITQENQLCFDGPYFLQLSSLSNRIIVGGLFCNLKKAFDCVNYDILLSKMKFYGITGDANRLMETYLRNSYQRGITNDHNNSNGYFSKWKEIQHGVPQSSVLEPLLFLIYTNDLSKSVSDKSSPILFADDASFIIANRDETKFNLKTNEIFNEINKWFHSNLLKLNYDKTYFLQFLSKTDK